MSDVASVSPRPTCATCMWWTPYMETSVCTHPTSVLDDGLKRRYLERPASDWCGAHTPKAADA